MSCNIRIPLQQIIDDVAAALSDGFIKTDNAVLTEAVLNEVTIRGDISVDTAARNALCAILQNCGITAVELEWLDRPTVADMVAVSEVVAGEVVVSWKDLDTLITEGIVGKVRAQDVTTEDGSTQDVKNKELLQNQAAHPFEGSYDTIDSFELGATLTQRNEALRYATDGKLYRWAGGLPKAVPAGSTPVSSGGFGTNAWLEVSDAALRQEILSGDFVSDAVIKAAGGVSQLTINQGLSSIVELLSITNPTNNMRVFVKSYHAHIISGCGTFVWDSNKDKSEHNGGTVIDPLIPFPTDWRNQVEEDGMVSKWFGVGATGVEGKGCWVRQCGTDVDVSWFGAIDDNNTDNTFSFNAATSGYLPYNASNFSNHSDRKRTIFISGTKTAYRVMGTVFVRKGQEIRGTGLGSCRIFIPVTNTVGATFRLGNGLVYNPFPANPVKTTADIGSTTVVLSGNPYLGKQYIWFGSGRRVKLDGNFYETESVTFDTDTTIVLKTPLLSAINAGSTFQAAEITDSGGLPPSISNLAIEGGHIHYPVIDGRGTAGMSVNTLFITAASQGIWGTGGDVNIHTVTFDNGGVGLRMSGSRNSVTGCHFFWNQIDIQIAESAFDWLISNCTFGFYKQYSVGFNSDSSVNDISFNNCHFFMNEQYATASGAIRVLKGAPRFKVIGCNFSNQKSWSIISASLSPDVEIEVRQCTFNGTKSHSSYIQSTTSSGIFLNTGTLLVVDCLFKNIHNSLIENNITGSHITIKDNLVMDYTGSAPFLKSVSLNTGKIILEDNRVTKGTPPLLVNENLNVSTANAELIKLVRNNGFYKLQTHSEGRRYVKLPYLRGDSFLIRVKYNGNPTSSAQYRRSAVYAVSTATAYDGSVLDYVTLDSLTTPVGGTIPPALDVQIDIDDVGEGTSKSFNNNDFRHLTISVPADANYFFVELI